MRDRVRYVGSVTRLAQRRRGRDAARILRVLSAKLTFFEIGLRLGVSWRTVYRWAGGAGPHPAAFKKLAALAKRFGIR